MGSLYKEQKKTNRILTEQTKLKKNIANTNFELQNKRNAELERQNDLIEQEQRNREYQKHLRDFIFEMKRFAEEIGSGKYSEIPAYTAARIVKTRIESEEITSHSFEQLQDKEYYSKAIESLDKVLENSSNKAISEGDLYFEKYQTFLRSIAKKEIAKEYFVNWAKNFLYTFQPDGDEFKRKLSPLAVGLLSASTVLTFFPIPILGGLLALSVTYIWLQKRIAQDYTALFSSISVPTNSIQGILASPKAVKAIEDSIAESENELRKFRQSNMPEIEKYELQR
ncbi:hypothetical protein [Leptospira santarosai]|uniref:Uncharacterized protein n=1 Tax=Leptospira santarosai serovar Arenal str. MAVJ 401 TaxID=1049976 RepID=M6K492_9LEPT|nr:hypothetical protein [Leptospira santarosai]EMM77498.1 hypothetical protein LEP1GSC040_1733 [Leptospira santarosai str. 2000030832]EMN22547.1 hypothetical protein LEP1GSC063_2798 [Leptospira santarosai serovar Arenal str. MAVJ 401]MDI7230001.1 hypothetical protein [Leptospira santarosai]MDI7237373.1 hypothetical protein [Leptospira santarosai]